MKKILTCCQIVWFSLTGSWICGQNQSLRPTSVQHAIYFDISPRLSDIQQVLPVKEEEGVWEVPNFMGKKEALNLPTTPFNLPEDPVWQKQNRNFYLSKFLAIVIVFIWNFLANFFFTFK